MALGCNLSFGPVMRRAEKSIAVRARALRRHMEGGMRKIRWPMQLCGLVLALAAGSAFAGVPAAASGCAQCHGEGGVSSKSDIPTIAGMSAFYLEGQMQAYQKGQRPCAASGMTDMCQLAKAMSPAEIASVAAYYEAQKFVGAKQAIDAALAAKGKAVHEARCEICHSDGGREAADDAGILAGQWKPYLLATFEEYRSGKRVEPAKMKAQTGALSADDVKALVEFYASEASK